MRANVYNGSFNQLNKQGFNEKHFDAIWGAILSGGWCLDVTEGTLISMTSVGRESHIVYAV